MAGRGSGWLPAVTLASASALAHAAVAQERPIWQGPAEPRWAKAETLVLQGEQRDGHFVPKSLSLPDRHDETVAAPRLLPLTDNILPLLHPRIFGVEERVALIAEPDGLRILCRAGSSPAGVVLEPTNHRYPRNMPANLVVRGQADTSVGLSLALPGEDAPPSPQAALGAGRALLPLRPDASALVVACSSEAGEILLADARIEPVVGSTRGRGSWVWDPADAIRDPADFARHLAALGLDEIAIQTPADPRQILPVARALAASGIALHLVEGDPDMIRPDGLARTLERVRGLRSAVQILSDGDPPIRLELDIEPYGRPDYAQDVAAAWRSWAAAVEAIARAWGRPVDVDVPWWMLGVPGGEAALARVRASIGTIVVMAYRTEPVAILEAAEPWLAMTQPVKIAIEAGEVASEVQRTYRRAPAGELVVRGDRGVLHAAPLAGTDGAATFALIGETRTRPERISFHGRDAERRRTEAVILPLLKAWPNFQGFRVHGLALTVPAKRQSRSGA